MPAVVLVAERHELRVGRRQPQSALEVPVEAEPLGRERDTTKRSSPATAAAIVVEALRGRRRH